MKNVMKQSGKALGYFLFYFIVGQIIVAFIAQFIIGMVAGNQARAAGTVFETQEEVVAMANDFYARNMGLDLAARAIFLILAFLIFFLIRKKNYFKEITLEKTSGIKILAAVLGAVFVIFCVNGAMSLLTPKDQLENFSQASSVLYAYPLWQAILANALLVPIVEEIVFRGLMFSRLQKAMPNVAVALITSVLFGLVHGQIIWMIFAFIVGLILSYVRIKTNSILPTIIMHILINSYATLVSYQIINFTSDALYYALMVVGAICLGGCIYLLQTTCKKEQESQKAEVTTVVV